MRLNIVEQKSIKDTFYDVFDEGEIYLFGSRVDDEKKGGDIDLYISLDQPLSIESRANKKTKFILSLEDKLGEQKIDVIISKDKSRSIEVEALLSGIKL